MDLLSSLIIIFFLLSLNRERAGDLEAQVKERDVLLEELVLSNQAQLERNEILTVQNEDLRGEFNEAVGSGLVLVLVLVLVLILLLILV